MKKVIVFGAGLSGNGAKRLLENEKYEVILVDDKIGLSSVDALKELDKIDFFVKSPGIPYTDLVLEAQKKNIKIIDEVELSYDYMKKNNYKTKIIAVTGTNGKTTVTTDITGLLVHCGYKAKYAGNIGVSFSDLVLDNNDLDYIVLELSSFQLENLYTFKPDIGMIINLTPDHLERYKDLNQYYMTKFNICKNMDNNCTFIMNNDSNEIKDIVFNKKVKLASKIVNVSKKSMDKNINAYVDKGYIIYNGKELLECDKLSLKGEHNLENVLFISTTGKLIGLPSDKIREFLYNVPSIEHRMENFYSYKNITFINDSKGTNIDASNYAIKAFPNCILICGGHDKKLDWRPLIDTISKYTKEVYFIGEIANILEEMLRKTGYDDKNIHNLKTIDESLKNIKKDIDANKIDENNKLIVLLSPSTSSYDQFKNFEERGKYFKNVVLKIFEK